MCWPRKRNRVNVTAPRIAPLTLSLCWGFAVINILLGYVLATSFETNVPLAVANILTYQQWGVLFIALGVIGAFGLITHRPFLVKNTQLASVLVKAIWEAALVIRCFIVPQSLVITLIWGCLLYVQMMVYIHFQTIPGASHGAK